MPYVFFASPTREARLPERRRLLVAEVAGDLHALEAAARADLPVGSAGRPDLRQHRRRHAHGRGDPVVPRQRREIHQHRAAGVRDVRDVDAAVGAAGQVPDAPRVDVAEQQVTGLRTVRRAVDVVEDPAHLRPGEVGRQRQPDLLAEPVLPAVARELVHQLVGARVLPHDRVHHRLAGVAVPHHRRLTLVGDPEPRDVVGARARRVERLLHDLLAALPDLHRIVLDPSRLRIDLLVLLLRHADDLAAVVEDHAARAGRALVEGRRVLGHRLFSSLAQPG